MKYLLMTAMVVLLASCGGGMKRSLKAPARSQPAQSVPFATGPMYSACMASERKKRSRALCGCVQGMARGRLSAADQRLAATFWDDPHSVQEIRQSDNPRNEVFWKKYKAYGQDVKQVCSAA